MVQFRIFHNEYGLHFRFGLFRWNFQGKMFSDYKLAYAGGIRNNTFDGKRVPFFDYDNTLLEFLIPELKYFQEKYLLSDFYVFKSSQKENSYHVIGLDKLDYREWLQLVGESSCDEYYRTMPVSNDFGSWVLRVTKKKMSKAPKLLCVVRSKNCLRQKSLAHALFLKNQHKVDVSKLKRLDSNTQLFTVNYATMNFLEKGKTIKEDK